MAVEHGRQRVKSSLASLATSPISDPDYLHYTFVMLHGSPNGTFEFSINILRSKIEHFIHFSRILHHYIIKHCCVSSSLLFTIISAFPYLFNNYWKSI